MSPGQPPEAEHIPRSAWLALSVTTLVFFLTVIDVSAVNVAFPSIRKDFAVSETQLSWVISGYNITVATGLLLAGRMADSIGRKRVFLPGVAVFMIGSLACGLAPTVEILIATRVLQAVGGAIVAAAALAVALPDFPPSRRGTVIGLAGATGALGAVAGPALGSVLIQIWSWRAIFLINVPLCLLVLVLGQRLLRETKDPDAVGRVDVFGIPIGTLAIGLIMFAIVQSEAWGIGDPRIGAIFVAGLVLVPVLIRRSATHPEPLLDLSLFRIRSFAATIAGVSFYAAAFTSGFLVSSLVLQELWDQPIGTTGLALVPSPLVATFVSPLAGRFADRYGHRWLISTGSVLCASTPIGYLLLLDEEPQVLTRFVPISLLLGVGVGMSIASWSSAGLADVGQAKFGVANATVRTVQQCFYAVGIAVVVTLLAAGGDRSELTGFRWAWIWIAAAYLASAAVFSTLFPAGSSVRRAAAVTGGRGTPAGDGPGPG